MGEQKNESAPQPEEPAGGVSSALADDVSALVDEARREGRSASRRWKVTLVAFVIVLGVIFGYLSFGVYPYFIKPATEPENIVSLSIGAVDSALKAVDPDAPDLRSGQLPDWAADQLIAAAPTVAEQYGKPALEDLKQQLPEMRRTYVAQIDEKAPELADRLVVEMQARAPELRGRVVDELGKAADRLMAEADAELSAVVDQVIAEYGPQLEAMEDEEAIRTALADAFEEQMGPYLDDIFAKLEVHMASSVEKLQDIVAKDPGQRSETERLEIRIIQLVRALFGRVEAGEMELPLLGGPGRMVAPGAAAPAGLIPPPADAMDWSHLPEDQRAASMEAHERERQRIIEQMQQPAPQPAAPAPEGAPPAGAMTMPPADQIDWSQVPEEDRAAARASYEEARRRMIEQQ